MKLLVHVALSPRGPALYAATWAALQDLQWDGPLDYILARNDTPGDGKYADLCAKHNRARKLALDGGYDAVLFAEYDMLLPEDALAKLLEVDADVVYGLYCTRLAPVRWLYALELSERGVTWISDRPGVARMQWGGVVESRGAGFGCTLVRRNVLQRIVFRHDAATGLTEDMTFALDCRAAGFRQSHHLGVVCGHINRGEDVVWPDPDAPALFRREPFGREE